MRHLNQRSKHQRYRPRPKCLRARLNRRSQLLPPKLLTSRSDLTSGLREVCNRCGATTVHCRRDARCYCDARRSDGIICQTCIARRCGWLRVPQHFADDDEALSADAAMLAREWRKSCSLTSSSWAALRMRRQGFSRFTRCRPAFLKRCVYVSAVDC